MIDDDLKIIATSIIGITVIVVIYPYLPLGKQFEPFSELALLGEDGTLNGYPSVVDIGESFSLKIYVGNHEGELQYYRIVAKLFTTNIDSDDSIPLDAPVIDFWEIIIANGDNKTIPVILSLKEAGENRRLVFELERFNLRERVFRYQIETHLIMDVKIP